MLAKVLVANGSPTLLKSLATGLPVREFSVVTATSGAEALAVARQVRPEAIILDLMLPGIAGTELCRMLRDEPEFAHVPVLMTSGMSDDAVALKAIEAGADDVLVKPLNHLLLTCRLRTHVRVARALDHLRAQSRDVDAVVAHVMDRAARIMVADSREGLFITLQRSLGRAHSLQWCAQPQAALAELANAQYELVVVGLDGDPAMLQLGQQVRTVPGYSGVPVLGLTREFEQRRIKAAVDHGTDDLMRSPPAAAEVMVRAYHLIRRQRLELLTRLNAERLRDRASSDALTGAYNRHTLAEVADRQIARARTAGLPLGVVIADLDHFKSVNDTWGHDAGDAVLKTFADLIRKISRGDDMLFRLGGEEFALVLCGAGEDQALACAERIRRGLEGHAVAVPGLAEPISVTASFGISVLAPADTALDEAMKRADVALYRAKASGRNRCEVELAAPPSPDAAAARRGVTLQDLVHGLPAAG